MAVAATAMNSNEDDSKNKNIAENGKAVEEQDAHEHDTVMPGFRFHPTEEELVEFYLRRKIEGKKFNVELITSLDLYRYDPWELPALAAIGEKEWYFYVPRDRKYRNGDRPNRVTTSGYWKATGADRLIRSENLRRPIGLKKTLVFYSGKAPKGIRTSWIMNEFRLPQHETDNKHHKVEISLCRVYKRAGVEDHHGQLVPRGISMKTKHCSSIQQQMGHTKKVGETMTDASSSTEVVTALGLSQNPISPSNYDTAINVSPLSTNTHLEALAMTSNPSLGGNGFIMNPNSNPNPNPVLVDDLQRLVSFQQHHFQGLPHHQQHAESYENLVQQPPQTSAPNRQLSDVLPPELPVAGFSDRPWEWSSISEQPQSQDFDCSFK